MCIKARNGAPEQLADQDVRQRLLHRRGSPFQQIRDAHVHPPVFQADEAVRIGESAKLHAKLRQGRARPESAEHPCVDLSGGFKQEGALRSRECEVRSAVLHSSRM